MAIPRSVHAIWGGPECRASESLRQLSEEMVLAADLLPENRMSLQSSWIPHSAGFWALGRGKR